MHKFPNIRIIYVSVFVLFAILLHLGITRIAGEFPSWWLLLNVIPYLFGFAIDMVGNLSPEWGFYFGLICQWSFLGYLVGTYYEKRIRRQIP